MVRVHIFTDKDGYVDGFIKNGTEENPNCIGYILPDDDPFFDKFDCYKIVDGELVYDETKGLERAKRRKEKQIEEEEPDDDNRELLETMMLFQLGFITETEYEGEILSQKEFEKIVKKAVKNKQDKKVKKKEKKQKIKDCKTLKELKQLNLED